MVIQNEAIKIALDNPEKLLTLFGVTNSPGGNKAKASRLPKSILFKKDQRQAMLVVDNFDGDRLWTNISITESLQLSEGQECAHLVSDENFAIAVQGPEAIKRLEKVYHAIMRADVFVYTDKEGHFCIECIDAPLKRRLESFPVNEHTLLIF